MQKINSVNFPEFLKFDVPELVVIAILGLALISYGFSLISFKPVVLLIGLFILYKSIKTIINN